VFDIELSQPLRDPLFDGGACRSRKRSVAQGLSST